MLKRRNRRNFKKIFSVIAILIFAIVIIVAGFFVYKLLNFSFQNNNYESPENIIRPVAKASFEQTLSKKLHEKNIIYDSLKESSTSGEFIMKMPDGPTVYFSQNNEVNWLVSSLILILQRFTVDSKKPTFIDLRGAHPIVKF